MAPPPVTPSPHRFVASKPTNSTAKSSSSLRFQQGFSQSASSQQFNAAPKFSFGSTQKPATDFEKPAPQHATPLSRRLRLPGTTPIQNHEDIEETGSDNEEAEGLADDGSTFALPTQATSKRRRPSSPEAAIMSSNPLSPSSPPTTPPYPTVEEDDREALPCNDSVPHARPRFVLPTPKPTGTPPIPSRPPVIIPPRSPSPPIAISAFFSPHRRGQKYIPGGLASTARDWIVETSQQARHRAHARRSEEEFWDMRFRVGDYRMEGPSENTILVQTRGEAKRWMLVGMGKGDAKVEVGCIVGIREPSWEVLVGNERYMMAIEWKVLSG